MSAELRGTQVLDRLGMHYLTAPGSVRGAVDFIHVAGSYYNVADFFIVGATPLLLLTADYLSWRATNRPPRVSAVAPASRNRPRARASMPVVAGVALIVLAAAFGANCYGGVSTAPAHVSTKSYSHARSVVAL